MKKWGDLASAILAVIVAVHLIYTVFAAGSNSELAAVKELAIKNEHKIEELQKKIDWQYSEIMKLLMDLNGKR